MGLPACSMESSFVSYVCKRKGDDAVMFVVFGTDIRSAVYVKTQLHALAACIERELLHYGSCRSQQVAVNLERWWSDGNSPMVRLPLAFFVLLAQTLDCLLLVPSGVNGDC